MLSIFTLALILHVVSSKNLWTLDKSDDIHHYRKLEQLEYTNSRYNELSEQILFSISMSDLVSLKQDDYITFEVPSKSGNVMKECNVHEGFVGVPKGLKSDPNVKTFSCFPSDSEELQLIINANTNDGFAGNFFDSSGKSYYINSAIKDTEHYIIYNTRRYLKEVQAPEHLVIDEVQLFEDDEDQALHRMLRTDRKLQTTNTDVIQYDIAVVTSDEFSRIHGDTIDSVSAYIIQAISRVNGNYLREVGVFFNLINNFEDGICLFTNENKPGCENVLNARFNDLTGGFLNGLGISPDQYDLASLLYSDGAGGIAALRRVCTGQKAFIACDSFFITADVDVFASFMFGHEIGHMLGAQHTLRDCQGFNGGGNRDAGSAIEPGSGTTMMSLGGSGCQAETNIIRFRDEYMHSFTINQIREGLEEFVETRDCGRVTRVDRERADIRTVSECTVPLGNNFLLSGQSDGPASSHYNWERVDPSIADFFTDTDRGRFRSFPPVENRRERFFPNLHYLNFLPDPDFELLPTIETSMTFRFSQRNNFVFNNPEADSFNRALVGAFTFEDTSVNFVDVDPFRLTEPSNNVQLGINEGFEVKWDLGGIQGLSSDDKVQFLFAENTMSPISENRLVDIEYADDVDDLDWILINEVSISDFSSNTICLEIKTEDIEFDRIDQIDGNLLVRISTSQDSSTEIRDLSNCYVFDLITGISLFNRTDLTDFEEVCTPVEFDANDGEGNNNVAGGGGLSGGGIFGIIFLFLVIGLIAGFVGYKKFYKGEELNFSDALSLNSKKPKAVPLKPASRWPNRRGNIDLSAPVTTSGLETQSTKLEKVKTTVSSTASKTKNFFSSLPRKNKSSDEPTLTENAAVASNATPWSVAESNPNQATSVSQGSKTSLSRAWQASLTKSKNALGTMKSSLSRSNKPLEMDDGVVSSEGPSLNFNQTSTPADAPTFHATSPTNTTTWNTPSASPTQNSTISQSSKTSLSRAWKTSVSKSKNALGTFKSSLKRNKNEEAEEEVATSDGPRLPGSQPAGAKKKDPFPEFYTSEKIERSPITPSKTTFAPKYKQPKVTPMVDEEPKSSPSFVPSWMKRKSEKVEKPSWQKSTPRPPKSSPSWQKSRPRPPKNTPPIKPVPSWQKSASRKGPPGLLKPNTGKKEENSSSKPRSTASSVSALRSRFESNKNNKI